MSEVTVPVAQLPGAKLKVSKMPGHWLLARLGKRVLRPGGIELTRRMLEALAVEPSDVVVELAPGLGTTTRLVLERAPKAYVGVERDADATQATRSQLRKVDRCQHGTAAETGLEDASATVVFGEAMLSMQTAAQKTAIVAEAVRVLRPGGRYAIHELALTPDAVPEAVRTELQKDVSESIHVGVRPLTVAEWKALLTSAGLEVVSEDLAPMHLLEPARMVSDEGLFGAARVALNLLRDPDARKRVLAMRRSFHKHAANLGAVALVARKPDVVAPSA